MLLRGFMVTAAVAALSACSSHQTCAQLLAKPPDPLLAMTPDQMDAWMEKSTSQPLPFRMMDFMRVLSITEYQDCQDHPEMTVQEAVGQSGGY